MLGNLPPNGGFDRFHALHRDNNLAVWLHRVGYYTAMVGKYMNGYSDRAAGSTRLVGVVRGR